MHSLIQAIRLVTANLELPLALASIVNSVAKEFGNIDMVGVFLFQEDGTLRGVYGNDPSVDITQLVIDPQKDQFAREILALQRPVYVSDTDRDARPDQDKVELMEIKSILGVPLVYEAECYGVVFLHNRNRPMPLTPQQIEQIETFISVASIAVRNSFVMQRVRELERVREDFLAMAAHELRTPTTAIKGFSQLLDRRLQQRLQSDPTQREQLEGDLKCVQTIATETDKLVKLIEELLDISRIERGKLIWSLTHLELGELVDDLVQRYGRLSPKHQFRFQAQGTQFPVKGDRLKLEQALRNLFENAVKYSPNGGVIEVGLSRPDPHAVRFTIKDQGLGIPPEAQPQIFQQYFRAHDASHGSISGFGIGLFLAQRIVSEHDGTIWFESQPGAGSTFYVELPLDLEGAMAG